MRRNAIPSFVLIVGLFVASQFAVAGAQESPGSPGVNAALLAAIPAGAGSDHELQVGRSVWEPGASLTAQGQAAALVSCVESGALSFQLVDGAASVTRAQSATAAIPIEIQRAHPVDAVAAIAPGHAIAIGPGDCVTLEVDAAQTVYSIRNEGSEPAVLWEARLIRVAA